MITRFAHGVSLEPTSTVARLLGAIDRVAYNSDFDLTVIGGTGVALDVASLDFIDTEKRDIMRSVLAELTEEEQEDISNGWFALITDEWHVELMHYKQQTERIRVERREGAFALD